MNQILSTEFIPKKISITFNTNKKIRLVLSLCAIILYYLINQTTNILNAKYMTDEKCFIDLGFILSKPINNFAISNSIFYHICAIFGSIILDITFLLSVLSWCFYDKHYTLILTISFFYGIRGGLQNIYRNTVPKEAGWVWYYPNFPSITINYFEGNDFFFSGHVGICILNAFFAFYRQHYIFSGVCFFAGSYEAFLVLITRTHYTIDIPIGFFFAHYSCILVNYWVNSFFDTKKMDNFYDEEKETIIDKSKDLEILE